MLAESLSTRKERNAYFLAIINIFLNIWNPETEIHGLTYKCLISVFPWSSNNSLLFWNMMKRDIVGYSLLIRILVQGMRDLARLPSHKSRITSWDPFASTLSLLWHSDHPWRWLVSTRKCLRVRKAHHLLLLRLAWIHWSRRYALV